MTKKNTGKDQTQKTQISSELKPEVLNNDEFQKFLREAYAKSAKMFSIGAKKVTEASSKIAQSTKLYYKYNQLKFKIHLLHAKLGELVEARDRGGDMSVLLNDDEFKKLLDELKADKNAQEQIKQELSKFKF